MANPQLEDGHTRIANELLEQLMKRHLSPNQWRVLLCIIRKTYGFQKKVDYIANFQIVEATGLCKAVVSRCIKELHQAGFITRQGKHIGFQKNWEEWQKLAGMSTEKLTISSTKVSRIVNKSCQYRQQKLAESSTKLAELSTEKVSNIVNSVDDIVNKHEKEERKCTKKEEKDQKKLYKRKYGQFQNVLLTDDEYQKLKDRFNHHVSEVIEELSLGIESKGYKYNSHYAAILNWQRRANAKAGSKGRELPKTYTPEPEYPD